MNSGGAARFKIFRRRPGAWALAVVAAAFVFTARLALVGWGGSPIPQWDQWDAEALAIYRPWLEGHLTFGELFRPHLEHHIVFTHLLNLTLLKIAGAWDPLLQMTTDALLSALIAGLMLIGLNREFALRWRGWILILVAAAFASPFAYQDILWGFQSQFVFLIGLSLLALWGLAQPPFGGPRWWIGLGAALLAPLAMAAGGLVGPAVAAIATLEWLGDCQQRRPATARLAVGLLLTAYGWFLSAPAPTISQYRVHSFGSFSAVFLSALAWPNCFEPLLAALAVAPCAVFAWLLASGRRRSNPLDRWLLDVAAWVCVCMGAMAVLRGGVVGQSFVPASRYQDILALLALVNGLMLIRLLDRRSDGIGRAWMAGLAGIWLIILALGLVQSSRGFLRRELDDVLVLRQMRWAAVLAYRATGSVEPMVAAGIHPSARVLRAVLDDPTLAARLPPELRRSLFGGPPASGHAILQLARGTAGSPDVHWQSDPFLVRSPAVLVLTRGAIRGVHLNLQGGGRSRLHALRRVGFRLGPWEEWSACVRPGSYRMDVTLTSPATTLDFLPPRSLGRVSLWTRRLLGWSRYLFWGASALFAATITYLLTVKRQ